MGKMRIIGLMSGTSLDGLDLVDVSIWERSNSIKFQIHNTAVFPYSKAYQTTLKNCFNASQKSIQIFSTEYGEFLGNAVIKFMREFQIENVNMIASHGHTVFHDPDNGITVQIGDGQTISNVSGIEVICDFRTQDVELGGQGAPLVPIGDKLLFSEYDYCLNLGGFANVSFDDAGVRRAFDICPVNIVFNHYTRKIGLEYDSNGNLAKTGVINLELLTKLNALEYYFQPFPKSLGYEFVVEHIIPLIDAYELDTATILRTFVEHIAIQLNSNLNKGSGTVLITGGGAYNSFLIERFKDLSALKVVIPSKEIIEFKEALIFALLGYLKATNRINCLRSVTGARTDHSSGKIYKPAK